MTIDYLGSVRTFHETFGHPVADVPSAIVPKALHELRYELIREELVDELKPAQEAEDIVAIADALTDILYVTFGAMLVYGLPADELFAEVQRSNMSKLGADGKPIYRADGKILKGPDYSTPDLAAVIYDRFPKDA